MDYVISNCECSIKFWERDRNLFVLENTILIKVNFIST